MPFDASFNDVYALGIRPACELAGAYCERVDEQIFQESILQRIYNQISKADLIIADLTTRNPNVFYETGYAHALGKRAILLTQNDEDIPFDLKHYPHIIYGGSILKLKEELERHIRWHIEFPLESPSFTKELEFYVNNQKVVGGEVVNITVPLSSINPPPINARPFNFDLYIAIHNAGTRTYNGNSSCDFGFTLPAGFIVYDYEGGMLEGDEAYSISLPDGQQLHSYGPIGQILPDAWNGTRVAVSVREVTTLIGEEIPMTIRIFTESGSKDVSILLALNSASSHDK